jgi:hypothetical protein
MRNVYTLLLIAFFVLEQTAIFAQGSLTGNLQTRTNFYQRDTLIGASNTPQYDNQLSGSDAWLDLNYSNWGTNFKLRFDLFNNSNLRNPQGSYSDQGIGFWQIRKKIQKLDVTAGYFYDQIGSGTAFQAYEARLLAIDNAIQGIRLQYDVTENLTVKGFTGKQKNFFDLYQPIIKGVNVEGFYSNDSTGLTMAPGVGVVNRTIDEESMQRIVANISTYSPLDTFTPMYNNYAFTLYNTLSWKNWTWYVEGVYKTHEAIALLDGQLVDRPGNVIYTSVGYAQKGLAVTLQGKRTDNFQMRTSPNETLTRGLINFIPPMARQNTYRLTARYNAATQELGEFGYQADIIYSPNKKTSYLINFSNITDLNNELLYRELYTEATIKGPKRKWKLLTGVQLQQYNQDVYEQKPNVPLVNTIIPYVDFLYKFNKKLALRTEFQYMRTEEDFGSWAFGLAELTINRRWTIVVSDMMTLNPSQYYQKVNRQPENTDKPVHFYTAEIFYNYRANRFSFGYIRQVEGIVCTGGVCRFEPAFSGLRFTAETRF